ncbi:MAG: hypothetical protein ACLGQU_06605 [Acidobacteriota bacterium]
MPILNTAALVSLRKAVNAVLLQQMEERGRISMGLLADAGYDPRQVAEAWRLLAPKHHPFLWNPICPPRDILSKVA